MTSRQRLAGVVGLFLFATLFPAVPTVRRTLALLGDEPSFGDLATEEMGTLEAAHGARHLGQWSRYDFFQPGPALFYVLVPAYAASGFRAAGLAVGAFVLAWLCVTGLVALAAFLLERWSGLLLLPLLVAVLGYLRTDGDGHVFFNWWNNFAIALPFAVLLFLAAAVASGRVAAVPWLAAIASFVVQTQAAVAPTVIVVAGISLAFLVYDRRAAPLRGPALATGAVLATFWFLPLLDEIHRTPGNASRLLAFFGQEHESQSVLETVRAVAQSLAAPVVHVAFGVGWQDDFRGFQLRVAALLAALQVVGLAAAAISASRRGARAGARLCVLGLAAVGASLWSVAQIRGPIIRYLLVWIALLGVVNWVAVLTELAHAARHRGRSDEKGAGRTGWALAGVVAAGILLILIAPQPRAFGLSSTGPLRANVRAFLRGRTGPVRLEARDFTWPWATAIAPALFQDGKQPCFDAGLWITDWWTCGRPAGTLRFSAGPADPGSDARRISCEPVVPSWEGVSSVCVDFVAPSAPPDS